MFITFADWRDLERLFLDDGFEDIPPLLAVAAGSQPPFDLRAVPKTFLGPSARLNIEHLSGVRFAIAARSWSQIADGVLYLQIDDEAVLSEWFPDAQQRTTRISRQAKLLRADGATICTRDGVLAASRAPGADSLMRETLRLMAGRSVGSLYQREDYQRLAAYLPARPLATAYLAKPISQSPSTESTDKEPLEEAAPQASSSAQPEPTFPRMIAGVYARNGRLEIAIRATRREAQSREPLGSSALERLRSLPQTTTLVWAGRWSNLGLDVRGAAWAAALPFLFDGDEAEASAPVGTHWIILSDQDLRGSGATPQFAVLIESDTARELNERFSRMAETVLDRLFAMDPVDPRQAPVVELRTHLGVPISSIDFSDYAAHSRWPGAKLLRNLQPTWAVSGDWWHFALSRDHLERLLDAQSGLSSTLVETPEFRDSVDSATKNRSIAMGRVGVFAALVDRWISDAARGEISLLSPALWSGSLFFDMMQPDRLGIGMRSDQEPGVVVVARVDSASVADGHLIPGDRILGIDGQLLDLHSPNLDLRTRWHRLRSAKQRTMRVERDGTNLDVVLDFAASDLQVPSIPAEAFAALSNLAHLARGVRFATYSELDADANHFAALISLSLAPAPQTTSEAASAAPAQAP